MHLWGVAAAGADRLIAESEQQPITARMPGRETL